VEGWYWRSGGQVIQAKYINKKCLLAFYKNANNWKKMTENENGNRT